MTSLGHGAQTHRWTRKGPDFAFGNALTRKRVRAQCLERIEGRRSRRPARSSLGKGRVRAGSRQRDGHGDARRDPFSLISMFPPRADNCAQEYIGVERRHLVDLSVDAAIRG